MAITGQIIEEGIDWTSRYIILAIVQSILALIFLILIPLTKHIAIFEIIVFFGWLFTICPIFIWEYNKWQKRVKYMKQNKSEENIWDQNLEYFNRWNMWRNSNRINELDEVNEIKWLIPLVIQLINQDKETARQIQTYNRVLIIFTAPMVMFALGSMWPEYNFLISITGVLILGLGYYKLLTE